jgi:ABC-type Zn uptake system ZnuABC Zn-binding protein ZnuA
MKRQQVKVILVEPYFDAKTPQSVASQVGGQVIVLAPSVGGAKGAADYIQLFDYDINLLTTALKSVGTK